ncbi:MAG: hypothetical protein V9F04_13295 [Dermatophilaceae bacterium]
MPSRSQQRRGHALDAEVDRGHGEAPFAVGRDDIWLLRRHLGGQICPGHLRRGVDEFE